MWWLFLVVLGIVGQQDGRPPQLVPAGRLSPEIWLGGVPSVAGVVVVVFLLRLLLLLLRSRHLVLARSVRLWFLAAGLLQGVALPGFHGHRLDRLLVEIAVVLDGVVPVGRHDRPEGLPPGLGDLGRGSLHLRIGPEDRVVEVAATAAAAVAARAPGVAGVVAVLVAVVLRINDHRRRCRAGTELVHDEGGGPEKGGAPVFYEPREVGGSFVVRSEFLVIGMIGGAVVEGDGGFHLVVVVVVVFVDVVVVAWSERGWGGWLASCLGGFR
mmetsp:Transcript_10119/g.22956  ORF Transcript_10119/g.22956 Transcript_10119/m.22956 type:complete len:269 (+) Transcript_10119:1-807(+)